MADGLFAGKSVLVTGAGVGIGFGLCAAFAAAGATVALNDVDGELATAAAARLNAELPQPQVIAYGADIADVAAVQAMLADFAGRTGRLDIVCANAGITDYGPFLDYTPAAFDRLVGVNLRGSYFTAQAAARLMIALGTTNGRIILTSSVTGLQGYPNLSAYGMTKAAISHLATTLHAELGRHQITVNVVCPGATVTERTLTDDPDYAVNWAGVTPTGRPAQVDDIANAVLFLARPESRHIGGQTIVVDGGWSRLSPIPEDSPDRAEPYTFSARD
ncbi:MAG: SDR family oxidoreductase [Anaerolineales bacterium]|nr:SDR family oxidoreductase [Anaerolineales bacterium]